MATAKGMYLSSGSVHWTTGGQGVHREVESEGYAEQYRAVIEGATALVNNVVSAGIIPPRILSQTGVVAPLLAEREI